MPIGSHPGIGVGNIFPKAGALMASRPAKRAAPFPALHGSRHRFSRHTRPVKLPRNRALSGSRVFSFTGACPRGCRRLNPGNALDRITQKSPGADRAVAYQYDLAGRQRDVRYTDNSSIITYAYDSAGRLTMVSDDGRDVSYAYDAASNRTRITWPDTFHASYFYDDLNRVTAITENGQDPMVGYLAAFNYDGLSRRTSMMMGNGTVTTYSYFADSALNQLNHDMAGTGDDVTYGFNYNMANQVTAKGLSNQTCQWNAPFDKAETAVPNGLNQLETVSQGGLVFNLGYDGNGSLTGDGTWTYTYDVENRLTNATGPGVAAVYEYDPLGRRSKKSGTATEIYLSDGVEEIGDYDAGGAILRRYVHGPGIDEPIVMYTGSGTAQKSYYHSNWQGSVVAMTNSTGTATDIYVYSPYGETDDPTGNPFRYTGRRIDAETGLYYYRARYYSPVLGRFLQTDPIGYGDGLNWYAYVSNDPVNNFDPSGEKEFTVDLKALAGIATGGKLSLALSFDTENFQSAVTFKAGAGEVVGAFTAAGLNVSPSDQNIKPAVNDVVGKLTASADVSGGLVVTGSAEVSTDLVTASIVDGVEGPSEIELTPSIGLGAGAAISNTVDASVTFKFSIVRDIAVLFGVVPNAEKINTPDEEQE